MLPNEVVYSDQLFIIAYPQYSPLAILQSRVHEIWARFFSSTLEDRLRYAPSDCFHTFPFPPDFDADAALEAIVKIYYSFRAQLMIDRDEGLTKTYNRFHAPEESAPDILRLRELHAELDTSVLQAYGWTDLQSTAVQR